MAQKRNKNSKKPASDVDVSKLQNWAGQGGSGIVKVSEPVVIELRYTTDMVGLAKILEDLADMAEACRMHQPLWLNEREEGAIRTLKKHAMRHAQVLGRGKKPDEKHLRLTMSNAQQILDGLKADYDRFLAGAFDRFDDMCREIRNMYPRILEGTNSDQLAKLQQSLRDAIAANGKVKPAQKIRAYKDVRKFLVDLDKLARKFSKRREENQQEISARRAVSESIFASIDRL